MLKVPTPTRAVARTFVSMTTTLYLTESRARKGYTCQSCGEPIPRGSRYFRHNPYPHARTRGQQPSQWCFDCITRTPSVRDPVGRLLIRPAGLVEYFAEQHEKAQLRLAVERASVSIVGVGKVLAANLAGDPSLVHRITPAEFEAFVCDRLDAMGFQPQQVGSTYQKDGGIDILFWPRATGAFPFLGAVQVKHHRDPSLKESVRSVRDLAGTIAGQPFNAALLVTNTSFSADAEWFARERAKLVRLRGYFDIKRWIENNFSDRAEWREIPSTIELCPGVSVRIKP